MTRSDTNSSESTPDIYILLKNTIDSTEKEKSLQFLQQLHPEIYSKTIICSSDPFVKLFEFTVTIGDLDSVIICLKFIAVLLFFISDRFNITADMMECFLNYPFCDRELISLIYIVFLNYVDCEDDTIVWCLNKYEEYSTIPPFEYRTGEEAKELRRQHHVAVT